MERRPSGWSVYLPLLIEPCTIKSRSLLLTPAHPGGPRKRAVKRLWCGVVWCNDLLPGPRYFCIYSQLTHQMVPLQTFSLLSGLCFHLSRCWCVYVASSTRMITSSSSSCRSLSLYHLSTSFASSQTAGLVTFIQRLFLVNFSLCGFWRMPVRHRPWYCFLRRSLCVF